MPLGGLLLIMSYQSQMERWVTFLGWNWGQIPRVQIQKSHLNRAVQIHDLRTKKSGTSNGTNKSVRPLKRPWRRCWSTGNSDEMHVGCIIDVSLFLEARLAFLGRMPILEVSWMWAGYRFLTATVQLLSFVACVVAHKPQSFTRTTEVSTAVYL